ncbi:MAG: SDR family oxidoreductase [Hyphomicrobium sp.]
MADTDARKVALVTGGNRGIGRGIALELAASGFDLMLAARDAAALERVAIDVGTLGASAATHAADLRDRDAPEALAAAVQSHFGRLDVLVNNAGAARRGDFFELPDAAWDDGFALKFFAHVRLTRVAWPLLEASRGSVVTISGIGARAPVADYMIGASVIGAQIAFMKALADIGKRDGVQTNTINPGSVETDRFASRLALITRKTGLDETAAKEHHRRELDITRFGKPEDVAGLVAFLVSPRGRWIHGAAIDIDGGQVDPLRMFRYD